MTARPPQPDPFHVPGFLHLLGGLVHRHPRFWTWLGRTESGRLADQLTAIPVRQPIYVCGLARSGSTLLHQVVASQPGVATHRAKDYPLVFTPYWWRRAAPARPAPPHERAHRDGVMVTPDSPEALEEMVWMAFFPNCHDPTADNRLGRDTSHPAFERFYDAHLRKLMLAEGATRYAAKANYHVARLPYLLKLYPDARIVVPVREPAAHVASLAHQHRWFSEGQRSHPRLLAFMRRAGHFEFGLDRRPIHLGDRDRVREIQKAWAAGDEVRGLAIYWDMVHSHLADLIDADEQVRAAVRVVRYEDVCADPGDTLQGVLDHGGLVGSDRPAIRAPTTGPASPSAADLGVIRAETVATAARFGY